MNPKPRQRYTAEFKAQAVELISTGKPVSQIAEELCISSNLLYKWKQNSQETQAGSEGPQVAGGRAAADDLRSLRREIALLKAENDILKKAAVILGTRPQPDFGK
jgi:transposase